MDLYQVCSHFTPGAKCLRAGERFRATWPSCFVPWSVCYKGTALLLYLMLLDYMDQQIDCGNIDVQNVNRDQVVNIYGRSADVASNQGSCSIHFRALDADAKLQIEFVTYSIKSCDVSLYLAGTNTGAGGTVSYNAQVEIGK